MEIPIIAFIIKYILSNLSILPCVLLFLLILIAGTINNSILIKVIINMHSPRGMLIIFSSM